MKQFSTIDILHSDNFYHLIVTPPFISSTYIITINTTTGQPLYSGHPLIDIFDSHSLAFNTILQNYHILERIETKGIIGIAKDDDNNIFLGLVEQTEPYGTLPGGHFIQKVTKVKFVNIVKNDNVKNNKENDNNEVKKKNVFEQFKLRGYHMFCETYDITRPYPSKMKAYEPDPGFIWNNEWTKPFSQIGLRCCCISLVQGYASTETILDHDFTITYILRRSCLNPGVRFFSRGLNESNNPANELECELIFERGNEFYTQKWRRGSAPIKWSTKLPLGALIPINILADDYSNGTKEYFERYLQRYESDIKIRVISLLGNEEKEVNNAYENAVNSVASQGINISMSKYDLNLKIKQLKHTQLQSELSKILFPLVNEFGFTIGNISDFSIQQKQKGICRFNCADSLDRANLATFFYSLNVLEKWFGTTPCQKAVDFIVKAFMESGNVVSMMYTNTAAQKLNIIRKFSHNAPFALPDPSISIQRKYQNTKNDPQRNKIIFKFLHPQPLLNNLILDPSHIFLIGTNFPISLFNQTKKSLIINCKTALIMLPTYMKLKSVSICECDAYKIIIETGKDLSKFNIDAQYIIPTHLGRLQFDVSTIDRFGIPNPNNKLVRFVKIRFETFSDYFTCGNIQLQCEMVFDNFLTLNMPLSNNQESLKMFDNRFNRFLNSEKKLLDVIILEKDRIGLHISQNVLIQFALNNLMNPYLCDSAARIISAKSNQICSFCGKQIDSNFKLYSQSDFNSGLIKEYDESSNSKLYSCIDCSDIIDNIITIENMYHSENSLVNEPIIYSPILTFPDKRNRLSPLAFPASVSFSEYEHNILLLQNSTSICVQNEKSFQMNFFQVVIISNIVFMTNSPNITMILNGCEIYPTILSNGVLSFKLDDSFIGQTFNFTIRGTNVLLYCIQVYGVFVNSEFKCYEESNKYDNFKILGILERQFYWDENQRTQFFNFQNIEGSLTNISSVGIKVSKSDEQNIAQSLIFIFMNNNQVVSRYHLILPKANENSTLWYNIEVHGITKIQIFYLDRLPVVKPHCFEFVEQKSTQQPQDLLLF